MAWLPGCRTERAYQEEWLDAHMEVAKKTLKKPLLLEEFGKKLVMGTDTLLFEQAVDQLRNPIFDTTYQLVQAALERCAPGPVRAWTSGSPHMGLKGFWGIRRYICE